MFRCVSYPAPDELLTGVYKKEIYMYGVTDDKLYSEVLIDIMYLHSMYFQAHAYERYAHL